MKVFCIDCGRTKYLYESEQAALNSMKFNNVAILEKSGKCPVRAYKCPACGGWHTTSRESMPEGYESRNMRMVNTFIEKKKSSNMKRNESNANAQEAKDKEMEAQVRKAYEMIQDMLKIVQANLEKGTYKDVNEALTRISEFMEPYKTIDILKGMRNDIIDKLVRLTTLVDNSIALYGTDVDMSSILERVDQKLLSAEFLYNYGMLADAQNLTAECKERLMFYKDCALMTGRRKSLLCKAGSLQKMLEKGGVVPAA